MAVPRALAAALLLGCSDDQFATDPGGGGEGEAESEGEGGGGGGDGGGGGRADGGARPDARRFRADAGACVATHVAAENVVLPVDIVWVVDNSDSMWNEARQVQAHLNDFASSIADSGLDYQVVLISEEGEATGGPFGGDAGVCIPPPLAGAGCGDGERYRQVPQSVSSHNALERILSTYPMYRDVLRPGALRHFVIVSDDDSDLSADQFRTRLADLEDPGFPPSAAQPHGFVLHAIVAEAGGFQPPCAILRAENRGDEYLELQELTGGVFQSICTLGDDWGPVFAALQTAVESGTELPCAFDIPPPPPGETLDPDRVNLTHTPAGGAAETIPRVASAAACGDAGGWYYDAPATPSQVLVCPATCARFAAAGEAEVEVAFGCATVTIE